MCIYVLGCVDFTLTHRYFYIYIYINMTGEPGNKAEIK